MKRLLCKLVLVAVLFAAIPASAQDIEKLNEAGITAFSEGRFADAAQKFHEAYAIKAEAPLKKNEALAWFKADKCTEALAAAKEYLALGVADELSTKEAQTVAVRCNVRGAEASLASNDFAASSAALADAKTLNPNPEDQQQIAKLEADIATKTQAADAERQQAASAEAAEAAEAQGRQEELDRDGEKGKQMLGLSIAATGGAIIVGTLVYHLAMALGTASKFKDAAAAGDRAEYDKLGKRLETANWLVPTLYTVGLATAGVGGYFWWSAGGLESDPGQATTGPRIESAGITLTWSF